MGRLQGNGVALVLGSPCAVGRAAQCDLQLHDRRASALHAELRWSEGGWELRDLGSRNGTFLDGAAVGTGTRVRLRLGSKLDFGGTGESWTLIDDAQPMSCAMSIEGDHQVAELIAGTISIPDTTKPACLVYATRGEWTLETDEGARPIRDGEHFAACGRLWRFQCPEQSDQTLSASRIVAAAPPAALRFRVSSDEEHVELHLCAGAGTRARNLGARTCFYLALTLARQRIADRAAGLGECGWLAVEDLLRMLPEYGSASHLNVDVFRLRQLVAKAGFDAGALLERRRGALRITVDAIEIEALRD